MEETTQMHSWSWKYRYFEKGHVCGIKTYDKNWSRRIKCNCTVFYKTEKKLLYIIYLWLVQL